MPVKSWNSGVTAGDIVRNSNSTANGEKTGQADAIEDIVLKIKIDKQVADETRHKDGIERILGERIP